MLLDGVVVILETQQRAHAREQLELIERFGDEVVRARPQRLHALVITARGDHHDRQEARRRIVAETPAHVVAIQIGHHDVEQHEVRVLPLDRVEPSRAGLGGDELVPTGGQDRLEQPKVLGGVVDGKDLLKSLHLRPTLM